MGILRNNLNFPNTLSMIKKRNNPTPWRIPLIPGSLIRMMCWSVEGTEGMRCRMRIGGVPNGNCQYSRHLNHRMKTVESRRSTILASDMIGETGDCLTRGSDHPRRKARQSEWAGVCGSSPLGSSHPTACRPRHAPRNKRSDQVVSRSLSPDISYSHAISKR